MDAKQAKALREPFPASAIGKLPKGGVMLDFVGHAATTDRLLAVDPEWSWEPFAVDERGLPALDSKGNLWIRLTVAGVTRIGVGDGKSAKEVIGDAIRNAAMRFGVALDLWAREDLHEISLARSQPAAEVEPPPAAESPLLDTSGSLARTMFGLFGNAGITDKKRRLDYVSDVVRREVESSKYMTDADAEKVCAALRAEFEVRRQADAPDTYDADPWVAP